MSHHTSETGQLIIVSGDTETPVYAQVKGGILHCMVRATSGWRTALMARRTRQRLERFFKASS
jgi:hypothetical protein